MSIEENKLRVESLEQVIRNRRTNLNIDANGPIDESIIGRLCDAIRWAPNHHRTWPWCVAVCREEGRLGLGSVVAESLISDVGEVARAEKARTKYTRAPVVLIVGALLDEDSAISLENRDAVAAGIQNLLLLATAFDLASFWSTCPTVSQDAVAQFSGFPTGTYIAGIIYVGWPKKHLEAPVRPNIVPRFL